VGAGAQLLTPEPDTRPLVAPTWHFDGGTVPVRPNSFAPRARIAFTSGIWIEPRASLPGPTSGCVMTARYVERLPILLAMSAMPGTILRETSPGT
jgi:hypothetical protein